MIVFVIDCIRAVAPHDFCASLLVIRQVYFGKLVYNISDKQFRFHIPRHRERQPIKRLAAFVLVFHAVRFSPPIFLTVYPRATVLRITPEAHPDPCPVHPPATRPSHYFSGAFSPSKTWDSRKRMSKAIRRFCLVRTKQLVFLHRGMVYYAYGL